MRPSVLVVSRIVGLREAIEARGLTGPWIKWIREPEADDLATCEVLLGEPAVCAPLVGSCPNLRWMQSTFAGCNQLLDQPRRDVSSHHPHQPWAVTIPPPVADVWGPCLWCERSSPRPDWQAASGRTWRNIACCTY